MLFYGFQRMMLRTNSLHVGKRSCFKEAKGKVLVIEGERLDTCDACFWDHEGTQQTTRTQAETLIGLQSGN